MWWESDSLIDFYSRVRHKSKLVGNEDFDDDGSLRIMNCFIGLVPDYIRGFLSHNSQEIFELLVKFWLSARSIGLVPTV